MRHHSDQSPSGDGRERETGRRERNARGQGERLREEILAAVDRLFTDEVRVRPLSLSMREVAREAGITAPAIYRHFENKDELAWAAVQQGFCTLAARMTAADEAASGGTAPERLAAQAHAYCRFAAEHRGYFRLMFRLNPAMFGEAASGGPGVEVADCWRAAVQRLRTDTDSRIIHSPEQAALSLWASVHGRLVLEPVVENVWDLGDVHEFVDALMSSLETR